MGATIVAYWPGITEAQIDAQPGFDNDDQAWGDWMAERDGQSDVTDALRKLKAEALLTFKTDGWDDEDVTWVTPKELREAASNLRAAVRSGTPEGKVVLASYERNANGVFPVADELVIDLDNIIAIATWAEREGATRMTLEVNW